MSFSKSLSPRRGENSFFGNGSGGVAALNLRLSMNLSFIRPAGTGMFSDKFPAMNCRAIVAASFQEGKNFTFGSWSQRI